MNIHEADSLAYKLIDDIQTTPADGVLILNLRQQASNEKLTQIQENMEVLAKVLNRPDIEIVVTSHNGLN